MNIHSLIWNSFSDQTMHVEECGSVFGEPGGCGEGYTWRMGGGLGHPMSWPDRRCWYEEKAMKQIANFMKPAKRKKKIPVRGHLAPNLCSSEMAGSGGMLRRRRRSRSWVLVHCCRDFQAGGSQHGGSSTGGLAMGRRLTGCQCAGRRGSPMTTQ